MTTELYLITPPRLDDVAGFCDLLGQTLDAGEIACLQLRLKDVDEDTIKRAVEAILPVCHARRVPLLLNDDPELAVATGCDGVHVGQDDMQFRGARKLMGENAMIGVTCKDSIPLALDAADEGADYVAFGAFFPSSTKDSTTAASLETIEFWTQAMTVPCVAIGGITHENCGPLVAAGADFLAVIGGIWGHPDGPAAAVKAFEAAIAEHAPAED